MTYTQFKPKPIRMPLELKQRWIDALRSGKYEQGTGSLKDEQGRYCCLGVLVEELNGVIDTVTQIDVDLRRHVAMPTVEFLRKHGIETATDNTNFEGEEKLEVADPSQFEVYLYNEDCLCDLPMLNDDCGYTFNEIADVIEEHVEGYTIESSTKTDEA